ncbi:hypothetical protein phytr_4420 [Candidatus Phycorickettsia trachydisci]|uniref:Methyltransferase type 11 domain-containing protein n=1 Tax=Candidatus Phycorickettsia trachydisci TaxID=2115978 RepID=A0A2P1P803_9RICK|nr:class I SAM-dependent methyltransferase [Candidatus Phycorickettsia trachydisci]AVP87392.1 hypothetical protein phytr_4420 [Candidatus Phycorickettsia trachydisci]
MPKPHSKEYFGEWRNFWWNRDFLELIGKRFNLKDVTLALDIGCGIGHWGRALYPLLSNNATLIGIDREEEWIKVAKDLAKGNLKYQQASAEKIPFPDNHFDLVTCQTVLIHVKDPKHVISEMLRVLKPEGKLLLIEPNNQATSMVRGNHQLNQSVEDRIKIIKLQMTCEAGKELMGLGFNSVGDQLPLILSNLDLRNITVYQTDKVFNVLPPYDTEDQRVMLEQTKNWAEKNFWIWDKEETYTYFLAGGGNGEEFENLWAEVTKTNEMLLDFIKQEKYAMVGGSICYIIFARKPLHLAQ